MPLMVFNYYNWKLKIYKKKVANISLTFFTTQTYSQTTKQVITKYIWYCTDRFFFIEIIVRMVKVFIKNKSVLYGIHLIIPFYKWL